MATRAQLRSMVAAGQSYEEIAHRQEISPGLAYLIVTGLPADGSEAVDSPAGPRPGLLDSSQHLANPPTQVPTTNAATEAWIKARVASDRPLRQAGAARTGQPPPVTALAATDDVISVLGWDHGQFRVLSQELAAIPVGSDRVSAADRQRAAGIVAMLRDGVVAHESLEQEHLWPVVRQALAEGEAMAGEAIEQEQQGHELLDTIATTDPADSKFDELAAQLISALNKHLALEDTVFLRFQSEVPEDHRDEIGRQVRRAKGLPSAAALARQEDEEDEG